MIRRPPRSTHCISSAASDVYKRQMHIKVEQISLANNAMKVLISNTEYNKTYIQDSDVQSSVNLVVAKVYTIYMKQIKDSKIQTQDYFLDNAVFFSSPFLRIIHRTAQQSTSEQTCPFKTVDSKCFSNENVQGWETFVYAGSDKLHGKDSGVVINSLRIYPHQPRRSKLQQDCPDNE
eukprot:TRINITY_DN2668_c0_g2_i2.p1 TRINITY_DN2668_c0_g2~~TRINITY_DN2668_c0_g2_i2.p1  ORF type:complete len:184 (+),score=31.51 TRINITY_DN2668_c0_g2_i2:24-554(+)